MTQILSTAEYKAFKGITDSAQDAKLNALLPWIDQQVRTYTDRDFGTTPASATRTYPYRGGGSVEIDDCSLITQVKFGDSILSSSAYTPQPYNGPAFFWLDLNFPYRGFSPEMGFESNWDTLYPYGITAPVFVEVIATFGWSTIPGDVKLAAALLAETLVGRDTDVQSKSIDSYSVSYMASQPTTWPRQAVDLLDPYRRINI